MHSVVVTFLSANPAICIDNAVTFSSSDILITVMQSKHQVKISKSQWNRIIFNLFKLMS